MNEVEQLEDQMADNKVQMERRDAALRLFNNRDFQSLILEYFCEKECARYVHSSADPALTEAQRADAMALAQASGHLKRFLSVVCQKGYAAEHQNRQIEDEISAVRAEEDTAE